MSDGITSSSRSVFSSAEARREALWWAGIAISVPIAGAAVWWLSENTINRLAPKEVSMCLPKLAQVTNKTTLLHELSALGYVHACEVCFVICSISIGPALYRSTSLISSQSMPSGAEVSHSDPICECYRDENDDRADTLLWTAPSMCTPMPGLYLLTAFH